MNLNNFTDRKINQVLSDEDLDDMYLIYKGKHGKTRATHENGSIPVKEQIQANTKK